MKLWLVMVVSYIIALVPIPILTLYKGLLMDLFVLLHVSCLLVNPLYLVPEKFCYGLLSYHV